MNRSRMDACCSPARPAPWAACCARRCANGPRSCACPTSRRSMPRSETKKRCPATWATSAPCESSSRASMPWCTWAASPPTSRGRRSSTRNIVGVYNLYESARIAGTKRIIFASSNHAIGFYPRSQRIDADDPVRPDSLYGVSKTFGENLSRFYFDRYGIETVCLRIGSAFPEPQRSPHADHVAVLCGSHEPGARLRSSRRASGTPSSSAPRRIATVVGQREGSRTCVGSRRTTRSRFRASRESHPPVDRIVTRGEVPGRRLRDLRPL